ncbi:MAG: hypothetical protein QXK06_03640 [Candidatus Diapherotrites archaeon]
MAKEKAREREIVLSPQELISLYENQRNILETIVQQESAMLNALSEIAGAEEALKEIEKAGSSPKILVLLGAGVFAEAQVSNKQVKSDIGTGILETTEIAKALNHLENKKKNVSANLSALQKKKQEVVAGLTGLEDAMRQMQAALAKKSTSPSSVS